jgi:ribosomal protein S18 acetylase RimI-like enzyme
MAELGGGAWEEGSGLLLYRTPVPDPVVWNGAILTGDPHDPVDQLLERADAFFAPHAESYGFFVVGSRDAEMAAFLTTAGAEALDDAPHMLVETARVPDADPALAIGLVTDDAGRQAFVEVAGAAFQTIGADPETWPVVYRSLGSVCAEDVIAVVASTEGRPVGAAMGYLSDGLCEVIHVAAVPAARRRGIGKAVTARVVAEARARGATMAVLQATEHGEGVYRSLGFEEIDRYGLHLRTVPPSGILVPLRP